MITLDVWVVVKVVRVSGVVHISLIRRFREIVVDNLQLFADFCRAFELIYNVDQVLVV